MKLQSLLFAILLFCCVHHVSGAGSQIVKGVYPYVNVSKNAAVLHMEEDLQIPGNILFSDDNSIKTTNGTHTVTIAGNTTAQGYLEGIGPNARFNFIPGFLQLSKTKIVVLDALNHCMRMIDRNTLKTEPFAGNCRKKGLFSTPWSVIRDKTTPNHLLVVSYESAKLQSVSISSRLVTTFAALPSKPKGIIQLSNGDLLVSNDHAIYKLSYSLRTLEKVTGSDSDSGIVDGTFTNSRFFHPQDFAKLSETEFLLGDKANGKVRILDMDNKTVSTFCGGKPEVCDFSEIWSLLLSQSKLYIGGTGSITVVEDVHAETPVIKTDGTKDQCMLSIDRIASPDTGTAKVDLSYGQVMQVLQLPIGRHPYYLQADGVECNMTINVYDPDLERTLEFGLVYAFTCDHVNSSSFSVTRQMAIHNTVYLNEICGDACAVQNDAKSVRFSCDVDGGRSGLLYVSYRTDVVFGGDVKTIPERMNHLLTQRLIAKGMMMSLVDSEETPPVVFPLKNEDGAVAFPILTTSCGSRRDYNKITDSCK